MSDLNAKKVLNPGPLGLLGFGMTTVLLNVHNAGIVELSIVTVAMGFALGGVAQIIAGIFELRLGNTFAGTAFVAYGFFWLSLIIIWMNPAAEYGILTADPASMGIYLLLWGIFSLFMGICTLKHAVSMRVVFFSLVLLFFGLAISDFLSAAGSAEASHIVHTISGIIGIICGASAIYTAMGQMINGEYGKNVVPL
jgi:succinate-acetate transporter protein